ncbi:MAG TPA: hypothetical protein PKI66_05480 [Methanobacteriaceae archaeon]|jgi:hypothetical protein|nr:hypothetical protein [Euryarchaeota archaeon]HNR26144.1 hypothetical protein [Methanobacteriaceae archaeon]HNS25574.1 hypothetical protein [Methanobacteriaceae archaeon]
MSCYLRYMKDVLEEADLHPQDRKERKEVDLAIRRIVGKSEKDQCNMVWKEVKLWLAADQKKALLVENLKD